MSGTRSKTAQDLLEAFSRFRRLNWHHDAVIGLKPREVMVLSLVKERAESEGTGVTISELSESLKVTSPTVTQLINSLESDGYVERTADPVDRRAVRIGLTEKGEDAIAKALERFHALFDGLVEHLGEEDSRLLSRLLSRVFEYFRQIRR